MGLAYGPEDRVASGIKRLSDKPSGYFFSKARKLWTEGFLIVESQVVGYHGRSENVITLIIFIFIFIFLEMIHGCS